MFDHTKTTEVRWWPAVNARAATTHAEISAQISGLGFELPNPSSDIASAPGGLSLQVSVRKILRDKIAADAFLDKLARLAANKIPVCLQPEDFPDTVTPIDAWRLFCEVLAAHLSRKKLPIRQISTCMHSHRMPLPAYCLIADSLFGRGRRYVFLDGLQMAAHSDPRV